jgi:large subunit ribosomal protein L16
MLYRPKKTKYKNFQKMNYKLKGLTSGLFLVSQKIGFFLKSLNSIRLRSNQIEATRRVIRRLVKKQGLMEIALNFDQNSTEKSSGVRMGKGKGGIKEWFSSLNAGRILLFLMNLNYIQSKFVLIKAKTKLAFKNIIKNNYNIKNKYYY